ncbi:MAG: carboxypeptidase regulatory-like domain-containing protein [Bryobacteraceae bacterium]
MKHAILWITLAIPLSAQIGGGGSIQGVVSDTSGAIIPGAAVSATNVKTGIKTERETTSAGLYTLSPLAPAEYSITVAAAGFQTLVQEHVVVDALSVVGLNLTLKVGAAAEQVTVTDTPPTLNTSDASLGQTMRNELYTSLPLQMGNAPRDPTAFTQLMPGVSSSSATGNTAGNARGGQDHSQEVYVEGLAVTNPVGQGETRTLGLGISVEAVDQFQMETAGTAVMYNGQGASNFVLKSGTNGFHGAAYEYFRNTDLDARGFVARVTPIEHQNEFGFNIGGPIKKNKLFFFSNYDGYRFAQTPQPGLQTVPTLAERNGNFSALPVTIYDPATTDCSHGPCTRQAFPGNIIPANRISSVSKYFQSFLPNPTNGNIQSNYLGTVPVGYTDNSTTNKVDYSLNDKNTFYILFSRGHRSQTTPYRGNTLPLPYASTRLVDELPITTQAKHTYVATPNLINQFSFGYSRFAVPITNVTIDGNYPIKAGLTGLPPGEAASSFPEISWNGPNPPDA